MPSRPRSILLAAVLTWSCAGAAWASPPLWVVHGAHCTIVLFGSVHILPPDLNWEPSRLKRAVAHAQEIWFEIPLDNASMAAASQAAETEGLQPPGATLSSELSPADQARLVKLAQTYAVPMEELDRLRPWLAEIRLSVASYRDLGASRELGVEHRILETAPPGVRERAFETPEEQVGYLANGALPDQIASLEETFGELEAGPEGFARLIRAWMGGDLNGLRAEALDPLAKAAPAIYRTMVVQRNQRWLEAVLTRLRQPGDVVMVVGAGHLIGPEGLPALLRDKGVRVDGP
ncbi:MAG TPA: TraB/GumN family protein [Caulobacteraceae bacterium]|jgi:hypothetical protein|nr:TraB/GumN family protein [Caulobacteraceae bacterium]